MRKLPFPLRSPASPQARPLWRPRRKLLWLHAAGISSASAIFGQMALFGLLGERIFFGQKLNKFRQIWAHLAAFVFNQAALPQLNHHARDDFARRTDQLS